MKNENKANTASVIKQINDLYIQKIRKETEAAGIKNAYRPLLSALYAKDGGTQLSLAERTGIKAPTVSITLRKMEKEGMVERAVDESDLRKTHVFLTEKGKEITEEMNRRIDAVDRIFTEGMTKEQKTFFEGSLERIKEALK